jgi:hypothetical protein
LSDTLSDQNKLSLYSVVFANLVLFYVVVNSDQFIEYDFIEFIKSPESILPVGIGLVLTSLLNALSPSIFKHQIVFLRIKEPLPASEAFSKHLYADSRIDIDAIKRICALLPQTRRDQNTTWYKLFRKVSSDPSVASSHKDFLFFRDYCVFSLYFFLVLGGISFFHVPTITYSSLYCVLLLLQFALTMRAARIRSVRLVETVLALNSVN